MIRGQGTWGFVPTEALNPHACAWVCVTKLRADQKWAKPACGLCQVNAPKPRPFLRLMTDLTQTSELRRHPGAPSSPSAHGPRATREMHCLHVLETGCRDHSRPGARAGPDMKAGAAPSARISGTGSCSARAESRTGWPAPTPLPAEAAALNVP